MSNLPHTLSSHWRPASERQRQREMMRSDRLPGEVIFLILRALFTGIGGPLQLTEYATVYSASRVYSSGAESTL